CDGYEDWIEQRAAEVSTLDASMAKTAEEHLALCRETYARLCRGIQTLAADQSAFEAFQLANSPILKQRARTVWLKSGKPAIGPVETDVHQWRPFQLAFILLCLPGIADPSLSDLQIADLLWFPTGGGKTEAYLGLIAFVLFLRRLRL